MAPHPPNCQALAPNPWGLNPTQFKDPISYSWAIFWALSGYHSHAHSQAFIQALSQALKWALRSSQGLRRACWGLNHVINLMCLEGRKGFVRTVKVFYETGWKQIESLSQFYCSTVYSYSAHVSTEKIKSLCHLYFTQIIPCYGPLTPR